jgi:hypothetical protein
MQVIVLKEIFAMYISSEALVLGIALLQINTKMKKKQI